MAGRFDVLDRLRLRRERRIFERRGISGLPYCRAGRRRGDFGRRIDGLRLLVALVVAANSGRRHGAVVVRPDIGRIVPVVAGRFDVFDGLRLRLERRVFERRGIGRLSCRRAGRRRGDFGSRVDGLGLHMGIVSAADSGRRHAAVVVRPDIGRIVPVVVNGRNCKCSCFHAVFVVEVLSKLSGFRCNVVCCVAADRRECQYQDFRPFRSLRIAGESEFDRTVSLIQKRCVGERTVLGTYRHFAWIVCDLIHAVRHGLRFGDRNCSGHVCIRTGGIHAFRIR